MKKTKPSSILLLSAAFLISVFPSTNASAQAKKKVLFLGNSYTAYNNLPQLVADVALSAGDTVVFTSNTPGGYTFQGHSTNATSLSLLTAGDLDFVVLQEQSQLPSFPQSQVATSCFPYARALDSIAQSLNPCVKSIFYMTWGRKNGDASNCATWPPVCTYSGMDSLLRLRYMQMAVDNDAMVNPAGAIWRYIRNNLPGIELYQTDESHPSLAGSYATACGFYSTIFRKDPTLITNNAGLDPLTASQIRQAAKEVAFDSLSTWLVDAYDAAALFGNSSNGLQVSFSNNSTNSTSYFWDFGDGSNSTSANPIHSYPSPGNYPVTLYASNCFSQDSYTTNISVGTSGIGELNDYLSNLPNPVEDKIILSGLNITGLELISLEGKTLANVNGIVTEFDITGFSDGMYVLKLQSDSETGFLKILKKSSR